MHFKSLHFHSFIHLAGELTLSYARPTADG